jgi:uncharacterized OsmC-like protein
MTVQLNGWDVEAVSEAVEGIRQAPESGKLTWQSRAVWDGGFGLDVRVRRIEQLGEAMERHFTLRGDHPPELLGNNTGPTAIEAYMAALGSCMVGTFAAQATARQVEIDSLEVDLEGMIDLNGFFGLQPISPGLANIKLAFRVRADTDTPMLQEILDATCAHSPIFATTTSPVGIEVAVNKV